MRWSLYVEPGPGWAAKELSAYDIDKQKGVDDGFQARDNRIVAFWLPLR